MTSQPLMAVPGLLDEAYINGVRTISRYIGPYRYIVYVDPESYSQAVAAVGWMCQCWGGAGFLLVPWNGETLEEPWKQFAETARPDFSHAFIGVNTPPPLPEPLGNGDPVSVLAVLAALDRRDRDVDVLTTDVAMDDPWHLAHVGILGVLPDAPDQDILRSSGLRDDVAFSDLLRVRVVEGGNPLDTLIGALVQRTEWTFSELTQAGLSRFPAESGMIDFIASPLPPPSDLVARRIGHVILVLYEPQSVQDLCLLWNLRAAAGMRKGFPLAVPTTESAQNVMQAWRTAVRGTALEFDVGRAIAAVTGFSVAAREAAQASGLPFIPPTELLRSSRRPARQSNDVVSVEEGAVTVAAWDPRDRDDLRSLSFRGAGGLVTHLEFESDVLPPLKTLEDHHSWPIQSFIRGGWEMPANDADSLARFRWPNGWKMLEAAAEQREIAIERSEPGRAAWSLLRRVGSLADVDYLLHPPLVAALDELGQAAGITWWRERMRQLTREALASSDTPGSASDRIEEAVLSLAGTAAGREGAELAYDEMRTLAFSGKGRVAQRWLAWATSTGLLLRGARLECECRRKSWIQFAESGFDVPCPGCGRSLLRAAPSDAVRIRYRATELLIDVARHDALPHLVTMRWLMHVLGRGFGGAQACGAFPGVILKDMVTGRHIAEVDVLVLMRDGSLIPGECKRRAAGLRDEDIAKLDLVCARLSSPWSFLATLEPASACGDLWTDSLRALPQSPRFCFTAEHLYTIHPLTVVGDNPFQWEPPPPHVFIAFLELMEQRLGLWAS